MPPATEPANAAGTPPSWDPTQYLRFADARLRPALDLLAQVNLSAPAQVVDLGCGPGTVTRVLKARFPGASVLGIDGSAEMLAKARTTAPECSFWEADFATWTPDAPPDLIYSNAALHWTGGHDRLLPRLLGLLAPGGVLAVQMPAMHAAPLRRLQVEVAASGPWAARLRDASGTARDILTAGEYWDILRPHADSLEIWETTYLHPLTGEDPVVEWASGTSLRPFLTRLPEEQRPAFRAAYAAALRPHYPRRADGTTLLPFRRLFLLAHRMG
ncbi:MAG: methyltransferase domain-containing protein [Rhodospirillales bacterium]|jgi:trans-aconitate 2-methyltransferase|nr:methyltransferase domain-containing protein [Rhodospirillales bacterium]